ncbi:patatin-like phospholipase family protein [Rickettsiales endosymbiont of Trichoplax sp. H2]|uniref:patatin-like phospholipase family protein n=1 Tax=Rickettsiales endosymbiont of Trichoplax sp. H2 TaxID=2021221 RepID=UPI0012B3C109|nr:patatin-like phospholipase family protein [Rickettsiales endosymbiont of Trichoplax sp. H2]MSO13303.1 putative NTE family protein YlbK [Rickettsiales endosymbiont of Trichoplax sp. H2]
MKIILRLNKIVIYLFLLILISSCKYSNHKITEYPSQKPYLDKQINIALVLSGAGSKGIVHAGVIAAFEKYNIPIDLIVGSSAGSLVGLLYADSKNSDKVKEILINANRKDFLQGSPTANFFGATLFNTPAGYGKFEKFLKLNVKSKNYEELKIPLVSIATDISFNKSTIFNSGPIKDSIFASCAIPGLYKPIKIGDKLFVDGGVISPVPVREAMRFKPKLIIAVNAVSPPPSNGILNNISILYRSSWVTYYQLSLEQENLADLSINIDTSKYDWLDNLSKKDKLNLFNIGFKEGERLIKNNLTKLREIT